jgi:hypothetical protein
MEYGVFDRFVSIHHIHQICLIQCVSLFETKKDAKVKIVKPPLPLPLTPLITFATSFFKNGFWALCT